MEQWISVKEAAKLVGRVDRYIYDLIESNRIDWKISEEGKNRKLVSLDSLKKFFKIGDPLKPISCEEISSIIGTNVITLDENGILPLIKLIKEQHAELEAIKNVNKSLQENERTNLHQIELLTLERNSFRDMLSFAREMEGMAIRTNNLVEDIKSIMIENTNKILDIQKNQSKKSLLSRFLKKD